MACHVERQPFIYFRQPANLFNCLFTFEFAETETPNNVLDNACNSVHKQQELFRRIAETKEARTFTPS